MRFAHAVVLSDLNQTGTIPEQQAHASRNCVVSKLIGIRYKDLDFVQNFFK